MYGTSQYNKDTFLFSHYPAIGAFFKCKMTDLDGLNMSYYVLLYAFDYPYNEHFPGTEQSHAYIIPEIGDTLKFRICHGLKLQIQQKFNP